MKKAFLLGAGLALAIHLAVAALALANSSKEPKNKPQQTNSVSAAAAHLRTNTIRLPGKARPTKAPSPAAQPPSASQPVPSPATSAASKQAEGSQSAARPTQTAEANLPNTSKAVTELPPIPSGRDADRPLRLASPETGSRAAPASSTGEPATQARSSSAPGQKTARTTATEAATNSLQRDRVVDGIQAPALQVQLRLGDALTIMASGKGVLAAEQQIGTQTFYHRFDGNWQNPGFDPWTPKARARFSNRGLELPSPWFERLADAATATLGSRPAFFTLFLDGLSDGAILRIQLEALRNAGITNQSEFARFTTVGQLTCSGNNIHYTVSELR